MAHSNVDPSGAKRLPPLIEGKYAVEIATATLGKSQKGNETLKLEMNVLDGPDQPILDDAGQPSGDTTSCAGRKLTTTVWVDDKSTDLANAFEAFGVEYGPKGWESEDFVGKEAIAYVKVRIYDDEPVNNVKKFAKAS